MGFRHKRSKPDLAKDATNGSTPAKANKKANSSIEKTPTRATIHNSDQLSSRPGYNENKCRNVLVRYCAHIPRNYQYKDGIHRVFLVLREHIGDENLDLAGGVLYELIEIDCGHTDDAGAAYQRWRHDHMVRHSDFELPHVPHMTTITPSIIPTIRLAEWRTNHPERYTFVLSDSAPPTARPSTEPSCIRSQKAWIIDNTFYISSRSHGTRPIDMCSNAKEFHEMQWNTAVGKSGRLVQEREVSITTCSRYHNSYSPSMSEILSSTSVITSNRASTLRNSILGLLLRKGERASSKVLQEPRRRSWIPSALGFDSDSLFGGRRTRIEPIAQSIPLPDESKYQNGVFARKNMLVEKSNALPPYLPLGHMPTAETKATEAMIAAVVSSHLEITTTWLFRGPFTPQLGFDGGLDYQWGKKTPSILIRRFNVPSDMNESSDANESDLSPCEQRRRNIGGSRQDNRRQGVIFDLSGAPQWGSQSPNQRVATRQQAQADHIAKSSPDTSSTRRVRNFDRSPPESTDVGLTMMSRRQAAYLRTPPRMANLF